MKMTRAAGAIFKIPQNPQQRAPSVRLAAGRVAGIETRAATRGDGEVIELDLGITVYPPRDKGGRWRAVWHEDGVRKQCESALSPASSVAATPARTFTSRSSAR